MLLRDVQVGLWCAVSTTRIIDPIFFFKNNQFASVTHTVTPFPEHLSSFERT